MTQRFTALAALAEDPVGVPSTTAHSQPAVTPVPESLVRSSHLRDSIGEEERGRCQPREQPPLGLALGTLAHTRARADQKHMHAASSTRGTHIYIPVKHTQNEN